MTVRLRPAEFDHWRSLKKSWLTGEMPTAISAVLWLHLCDYGGNWRLN